jgi:hypothetical protein
MEEAHGMSEGQEPAIDRLRDRLAAVKERL